MKIKFKVFFHYVVSDVVRVGVSGTFDSFDDAIDDSRSCLRSDSVVKVEIVKEFVNG
nr:hypothetical protein THEDDIDL_THEDDIDL_CDS_0003 [Microvirus sp.]